MLLPENGIGMKCTQEYCHNNGIYQTFVAMAMRYISNVTLCVGRSKAFAGQYILYCPASRARLDIALEPGQYLGWLLTSL